MRILILNQYFPPDRAATGLLLGQLACDLAEKHDVDVICGAPTYDPEKVTDAIPSRLRMARVPMLPGSRRFFPFRILNYFIFMVGALFRSMLAQRPDVIMTWTDPPTVGLLGLFSKIFHQAPFVLVCQDVYPEVARAMGKANGPLAQFILRTVSRIILPNADRVVAIGQDMKNILTKKGVSLHTLRVIENWQDQGAIQPGGGSRFRSQHSISDDAFVVMHSGNIGLSQDFETFLSAAELLKDESQIQWIVIGDGARKRWLENEIIRRKLQFVRTLPYQSSDSLSESLGAADLHYISLKAAITGLIVPSKIYGILAAGKPMLAVVTEHSDTARIVRESGAGVLLPPTPRKVADAIQSMALSRSDVQEKGRAGRMWMEHHGGRKRAVEQYKTLLSEVAKK